MPEAIPASEDKQVAQEKEKGVIEKLTSQKLVQAARIVRKGIAETLSYYDLPDAH